MPFSRLSERSERSSSVSRALPHPIRSIVAKKNMPYGPEPAEHQVVYTTLHFDEPWTLDNYRKMGGWQAWEKILAEKTDPAAIVDELKKS